MAQMSTLSERGKCAHLILANISTADEGLDRCVVRNDAGSVTSSHTQLKVCKLMNYL